MLSHTNKISSSTNPTPIKIWSIFTASISSLKVVWRKDQKLDQAIENDKSWKQSLKVIKEVLNEPNQVIPLHYLEKRRERLRLKVKIETFLSKNPNLFDVYYDRIKPKAQPVKFLRVSERLRAVLDENERVYVENEELIVGKLCKLLMMSKGNVVRADKLEHVKREFGFPNDFLTKLVPKYPGYFKLVGNVEDGNAFLELVKWEPRFAKSVIELRADEETELTGVKIRPSFEWKLPSGFLIKKEMREWVRDWMEREYISPYDDASKFDQASLEMEKRTVGVFHELLSLSLYKRVPVPILGKFSDEFRFSNAFASVFTRHSGIFYMSLKGGIKTAMLREAYKGDELIDRDPLLRVNDNFVKLLAEGHKQREEELKLKKQAVKDDVDMVSTGNSTLNDLDVTESEDLESS